MTNHIDLINGTITIGLVDYVAIAFVIIMFMGFMALFLFIAIEQSRIADRYRLKYSFDREIERKEIGTKDIDEIEKRLNKREKRFKRRVFKD